MMTQENYAPGKSGRFILLVDTDFVMSNHLWMRVYSLSHVSTIGG